MAWRRHPFCQDLNVFLFCVFFGEQTGDLFGGAVVVGHIEGGESCFGVSLHGAGGVVEVEGPVAPLHIGDLPEAGQDAGDL